MKKIHQNFSKSYPISKIQKKDIKKLINLFSSELSNFKIRINEYEYTNNEINEVLGKNFDNLIISVFEIKGYIESENDNLYVSLSLSKGQIHFYLDNEDHEKKAILEEQINNFFENCTFRITGKEYSKYEFRPYFSLFEDEIREIIQIIITNCKIYKIKIDDYDVNEKNEDVIHKIDSFFEKNNEKVIKTFYIEGSIPPEMSNDEILFNYSDDKISLRLSNVSSEIKLSNNSNIHLIGIQDLLEKVLVKRNSFLKFFSSHYFYGVILFFSVLISYTLLFLNIINRLNQQISTIVFLFIIMGFIKFSEILYIKNTIVMRYENPPSSITSLYYQNRSQILIALISALLSAIVTVIVTLILTKIIG